VSMATQFGLAPSVTPTTWRCLWTVAPIPMQIPMGVPYPAQRSRRWDFDLVVSFALATSSYFCEQGLQVAHAFQEGIMDTM
jgi:hypothetical protein